MTSNPFVGTWRLVSFHVRSADGKTRYPYGPDVTGYLIYTLDQRVSAIFAPTTRSALPADGYGGTPDEQAAAYRSCTAYAGTYRVEGDTVTHHVEVSLIPNWVGTDLVRVFDRDGDRLSLITAPFVVRGEERTAYLVWERVRVESSGAPRRR